MRTFYFLAFLTFWLPVAALAQSDVLTGRITGTGGGPVVGARVTALSVESEITRSALTDNNGRYFIAFPDGGGRYVLRMQMIGMADVVKTVVREDEELLVNNILMQSQAIQLDPLEVIAKRPQPGRGQAGEQSTALSQDLLNRLPLPDLDPATLALLATGVTGTAADSLSGKIGFSVAGMSDLLNQIVLDGVNLGQGGLGVPEEGLRRTQVTTNTFDASRGGFAGGQVSMTSARGNNRPAGSFSFRLDDEALQWHATPLTNAYTRANVGASMGGPLLHNTLFYNGSVQFTRTDNHRFALSAGDPLAAQRSGVSTDSIARFLNILDTRYGFSTLGQTGNYSQLGQDVRLQGRVDWNVVQTARQSHTISARFNYSRNKQDSTRIATLDLVEHGGEAARKDQLAALSLNSRFGSNWTNALTLSFSEYWNNTVPFLASPEGLVRVTSDFGDGTRDTRTLVFGGSRNMPSDGYAKDLQASNDLSFLLPVGNQLHRLKVGGSLEKTRNIDRSTDNLFGTFTFNSLADFDKKQPERYERALSELLARTGALHAGLYIGDTWRASQPLEFTLGLRWDHSALDETPAYNPVIDQRFGRRTDIEPKAMGLSPRFGFNYRLNPIGQTAKTLTGGIGWFAGRTPTEIFSTAVRQTGLPGGEQRLTCIGAATPVPDWERYRLNPATSPTACADGGPGAGVLSSRAPDVTLLTPHQSLPSSLRFDVGYRSALPGHLQGTFHYIYALGLNLWGYQDINLNEGQSFNLAYENRPFYGTSASIVAASGATSIAGSRLDHAYGSVFDVAGHRESRAHQFTASISGILPGRVVAFGNYTLGFTRDQTSEPFYQATNRGNPNEVEWGISNNDRRHTMNLSLQVPIKPEFELAVTTRLNSGAPFTPLVNRDINGDGARNDRAFIFDPAAAPDTALGEGMSRLLNVVPGRVRGCLNAQLGRIADRNSCRDSWTENVDVRASLRPNLPRLERRLTVSVDTRNLLTGVDQLINGNNNLKGWGEGQHADNTLLNVRRFDRSSSRFIYEVNEGFGQARRGPNAFRSAFSLTVTARIAIGGQAMMSNRGFGVNPQIAFGGGPGGGTDMRAMMEGMMGAGGGGGLSDMMQILEGSDPATMTIDSVANRALINPIPAILARRDSLGLGAAQEATVRAASAALDIQLAARRKTLIAAGGKMDFKALMKSMSGQMRGAGVRTPIDPEIIQALRLQIMPEIAGGQREIADKMTEVQTAIGPAAWARVPPQLRGTGAQNARPQGSGFNATGLVDRMLANPLPVLLVLKDTLKMTPDQITQIQKVSADLDVILTQRREVFGKRLDDAQGAQLGEVFRELQPRIEETRKEVTKALEEVEKILTKAQWEQVPGRVKRPFQNQPQMPGMF